MNIYLIRHGIAEKISPGKKDRERNLTAEGKQKLAEAALLWKDKINGFTAIFCSPYLRAVQSAEIIAEATGYKGNIIEDATLSPGSRTEDLIELANSSGESEIALVGHQPDLSDHVAVFTGGLENSASFKEGTIAKISFGGDAQTGNGKLEFLLPPPQ